jgi:hypothetical protein
MPDTGRCSGQLPNAARSDPSWVADSDRGYPLNATRRVVRTTTPSCPTVTPYLDHEPRI